MKDWIFGLTVKGIPVTIRRKAIIAFHHPFNEEKGTVIHAGGDSYFHVDQEYEEVDCIIFERPLGLRLTAKGMKMMQDRGICRMYAMKEDKEGTQNENEEQE